MSSFNGNTKGQAGFRASFDAFCVYLSSVLRIKCSGKKPARTQSRKTSGCEITYNASQGCFFVAHVCFCCLITFI
jgi:hypothetical protein